MTVVPVSKLWKDFKIRDAVWRVVGARVSNLWGSFKIHVTNLKISVIFSKKYVLPQPPPKFRRSELSRWFDTFGVRSRRETSGSPSKVTKLHGESGRRSFL